VIWALLGLRSLAKRATNIPPRAWAFFTLGVVLAFTAWRIHHVTSQRDAARLESNVWQTKFRAEKLAFEQTVVNYKDAITRAETAGLANKTRVETKNAEISHAHQNDIVDRLRVELDRLRASGRGGQAARGASEPGDLPRLAQAPADTARAGQTSVLDEAICTENTVKLEGWQDVYRDWSTP
jgi:hypothetical protein